MIRIGIILGSVRPNRNGEQVAKWVQDMASRRNDAEFTLIDLRDYSLPHLTAGRLRLGTSMTRVEWYLTRGSAPIASRSRGAVRRTTVESPRGSLAGAGLRQ